MTSLPEVEPHLTEEMAEEIFGLMLDGKVSDDDIAKFLIALSERGDRFALPVFPPADDGCDPRSFRGHRRAMPLPCFASRFFCGFET